jgi:hypothetical protein
MDGGGEEGGVVSVCTREVFMMDLPEGTVGQTFQRRKIVLHMDHSVIIENRKLEFESS